MSKDCAICEKAMSNYCKLPVCQECRGRAGVTSARYRQWERLGMDAVQAVVHRMVHSDEVCDCCGRHIDELKSDRSLAIDHCHGTGKIRGELCAACNLGIGMLGDTLEGVMNAVHYLERYNETNND